MKKLFLTLTGAAGIACIASGQSLSPQVVAASGNRFSNAGSELEFTIGEVATSTLTSGGDVLTQGFHQPEIQYASLESYADDYTFVLYPNPTEQFVTITSSHDGDMQVQVYDAAGRTVTASAVFQQEVTLDLQALATGSYVLMIANGAGQPLHSYTITKTSDY